MTAVSIDLAGVVLAAGAGRRLQPLTDLKPKALCPVANAPLVDLAMAHIENCVGSVAVNAHAHRGQVERHFERHPEVYLSIEQPDALGTAGALGRLRGWIAGRAVLVHNVDAWHDADVAESMVRGWDGERLRLLVVARPPKADFGPWLYAGVCLLPWRDVVLLEAVPTGLYEVSWRQAELAGRLDLVVHEGRWFDTGTPSSYLAANLAASGGQSVVGEDAVVEEGADVVRSVVWDGAKVRAGERLVEQVRAPGGLTVAAPQPSGPVGSAR